MIQRPKGTHDHLPDGSPKLSTETRKAAFGHVQRVARRVLERAGAQEIDTPLFEELEVVQRGVGGSTDIVNKEMFRVYYFGDHGGYVLRPEGTAAIVRAYLQNGLKQLPSPLKLWLHGPMFRAENVQKGRLRQFHQIDCEILGAESPMADAEAIALMVKVVRELGLKQVTVRLGSVGDPEDRQRYNDYLRELYGPRAAELSEDSQRRLQTNPMRIIDSKSEGDARITAELQPRPMLDFLGEEALAHWQAVQRHLDAMGVNYTIDSSIVRGLDYYRRTAWELHHDNVGAKSALGGGGRYDGLATELGSKETVPGIGWAFGIERILLAMEAEGIEIPTAEGPLLYVAALEEEALGMAATLVNEARDFFAADFAYKPLKVPAAFKNAERRGAAHVLLLGSNELESGQCTIKRLSDGESTSLPLSEVISTLKEHQS